MSSESLPLPSPRRRILDVSVSVKLTREEKRALDELAHANHVAHERDDTLARLIRTAIRKTYPNLAATNGTG